MCNKIPLESLIDFDNINVTHSPLAVEKRIIEWLFWRDRNECTLYNENKQLIEIDNLYSFEGNIIDGGDSTDLVKGSSQQLSTLYVTKAVLALDEPLNSAIVSMAWKGSSLQFGYSKNGSLVVDSKMSTISSDISENSSNNSPFELIVYLSGIVLPELIDIFGSDYQNFINQFEDFKKRNAEEFISKLVRENDLEINDIKI